MGKNASGQTHYLSLSGFEIYGHVTGVCDDLGKGPLCINCHFYVETTGAETTSAGFVNLFREMNLHDKAIKKAGYL